MHLDRLVYEYLGEFPEVGWSESGILVIDRVRTRKAPAWNDTHQDPSLLPMLLA